MTKRAGALLTLCALLVGGAVEAGKLEDGFARPPEQTKPWCYWYWISDNISYDGITRDLEAMSRFGIGEALIGNIQINDVRAGMVKVLSEEWWRLIEHAISEGDRLGVNIGMFNCPGWSQSGGPWVKPEQAMRYVAISETRVTGPQRFNKQLPTPKKPFQDIAVLAFPAPSFDTDRLAAKSPRVTVTPTAPSVENLVDDDPDTAFIFQTEAVQKPQPVTIQIELDEAVTARSLRLYPADEGVFADVELQAEDAAGKFQKVRSFKFDRSNMAVGVGFLPRGPVTVSFAPVTAKRFQLVFTNCRAGSNGFRLGEIMLSAAAQLESYIEKQLAKMHPTPLPMWDTYLWPTQSEPDAPSFAVPVNRVRDITKNLMPDGTLRWDVPTGKWIILRTGMTTTEMKNAPAAHQGRGLEIDKMNRAAAKAHFEAYIGKLLKRQPIQKRRAFKRVVADSYEMGSENWTDDFAPAFRQTYGYDPVPWLPVLTGRLVGSADQSERFLWDMRRLVADRVATEYVGGLREQCQRNGLQLWLENYGHWGFPSEFLKYGSESDLIGGEFWVDGDLGSIELRAASSCANVYDKPFVSAEAFTGGTAFRNAHSALKARGDWAFCEGINHFVLHVYIHQPWDDKWPGVNAWFGTEFNRHNTWFEQGRTWVDYLRRCGWLLQQGSRVADVAYFIGEDAPKMTGVRKPDLPAGCDFDYINADAIEKKLTVQGGLLKLPHGMTYRALVLPEQTTMRPELLRKIGNLIQAGATVVGPLPSRSPSMKNYPRCDDEVRQLSARLRTTQQLNVPPDFTSGTFLRFTHRRTTYGTDIYFIANPKPSPVTTTAAFRVGGKSPEFWWPDTGRIEQAVVYDVAGGETRLPVQLGPYGSVFVVFRQAAVSDRIVAVTRNGEPLLNTAAPSPITTTLVSNNFTVAFWANPSDTTTLWPEANQGIHRLTDKRNEVIAPTHGGMFGAENIHAGCGIAVGTNGVTVIEHSGSYFSPLLVGAVPITAWTHVTLVYQNGRPSLYLNGVLAREGLQSRYVVHPGHHPAVPFSGALGSVETLPRPLAAAEVLSLMRSTPSPGATGPALPIELTRAETRVWQPGVYELKQANGSTRRIEVPSIPAPLEITGPWNVAFDPKWGGPSAIAFEKLEDWSKHPDSGIRFYSGKATYRKEINLPAVATSQRLFLDLGDVRNIAVVRLNGKELGTLWIAPWRIEITGAAKPGVNKLEVEVVNTWNNRLVGDFEQPEDKMLTSITTKAINKNTPLMPAGLLGPVRVLTVEKR